MRILAEELIDGVEKQRKHTKRHIVMDGEEAAATSCRSLSSTAVPEDTPLLYNLGGTGKLFHHHIDSRRTPSKKRCLDERSRRPVTKIHERRRPHTREHVGPARGLAPNGGCWGMG